MLLLPLVEQKLQTTKTTTATTNISYLVEVQYAEVMAF
jgi:hypothetical protein